MLSSKFLVHWTGKDFETFDDDNIRRDQYLRLAALQFLQRIYFEVVTPDRSDASAKDQQLMDKLIADVKAQVSKCRVETR